MRLLTLLSFLYLISPLSYAAKTCYDISLSSVKSSYHLAELMGKNKVFNIPLMMRYEDDSPLAIGEVILVKGEKIKTQFLTQAPESSKVLKIYNLEIKKHKFLKLQIRQNSKKLRGLASNEGMKYKVCD